MKKLLLLSLFLLSIKTWAQCPWSITNPVSTITIQCSSMATSFPINIGITGSNSDLRYLITDYPPGAAFNPTTAITVNINPNLSGATSSVIATDKIGVYYYKVTNSVTGCSQSGTVTIVLSYDPVQDVGIAITPPSCSVCCDGSIAFNPPVGFTNYSVSASSGTITGNPPSTITNLCYGNFFYTIRNKSTNCFKNGNFYINGTIGIKEYDLLQNVSIYPNPSNGTVFIKGLDEKKASVKLFSTDGKEIDRFTLEGKTTLEVDNLTPGIYFVELNIDGAFLRKKIIVLVQ